MKKRFLSMTIALVMAVALVLIAAPATFAVNTNSVYWGASPDERTTNGTFMEALDVINTSAEKTYVQLQSTVYADLLTFSGEAEIDVDFYSFYYNTSESLLEFAEGANVTFKNGYVYIDMAIKDNASLSFDNVSLSNTIEYYGGTLDLSGVSQGSYITIVNNSGSEIPLSEDTVFLGEGFSMTTYDETADAYVKHDTLMPDQTYEIHQFVRVSFDANNGTGTVENVELPYNHLILGTHFTAPDGLYFHGWGYAEDATPMTQAYAYDGLTLYAIWGAPVVVGGVELNNGEYLASGASAPSAEKPDGGYAYYKDGVLTLNEYTYTGEGYEYDYDWYSSLITAYRDIVIELKGENKLTAKTDRDYLYIDGINSTGEITVSGEGSLTLNVLDNGDDGIYTEKLTVLGGILTIVSDDDCIYATDVTVKDGILDLTSIDDEGIDASGNVVIEGGYITINAEDYGMDISGNLTVSGGTIKLKSYDSGIDVSEDLTITGGNIDVVSYDDEGFEVDGDVTVSGGTVTIWADNDAIDCDGDVAVTGGKLFLEAGSGSIEASGNISISGKNTVIYANAPLTGDAGEMTDNVTLNGEDVAAFSMDDLFVTIEGVDVTHTWTTEYTSDEYAHWHTCTDENCLLPSAHHNALTSKGSGYDEHTANEGETVCAVCGYDLDPERIVEIYVGGKGLASGEYLSNDGVISKTAPKNGGYAYYKDHSLYLYNYVYEGEGYDNSAIFFHGSDLYITLEGNNVLTCNSTAGPRAGITAIGSYIYIDGYGTLTVNADYGLYLFESACTIIDVTLNINAEMYGTYLTYSNMDLYDGAVVTIISNGYGIYGDSYDESLYLGNGILKIDATFYAINNIYLYIYSEKADLEISGKNMAAEYIYLYLEYDSLLIEGGEYDDEYGMFIDGNGDVVRYIRIRTLQMRLDDLNAQIAELNKLIESVGDIDAILAQITALNEQLDALDAIYSTDESTQAAIDTAKQELSEAYQQAIDVAVEAVRRELSDDYKQAISDAIASENQELSDDYAKKINAAKAELNESIAQTNGNLNKANTAVMVIGIIAGVSLCGNAGICAWILLGKRKKTV